MRVSRAWPIVAIGVLSAGCGDVLSTTITDTEGRRFEVTSEWRWMLAPWCLGDLCTPYWPHIGDEDAVRALDPEATSEAWRVTWERSMLLPLVGPDVELDATSAVRFRPLRCARDGDCPRWHRWGETSCGELGLCSGGTQTLALLQDHADSDPAAFLVTATALCLAGTGAGLGEPSQKDRLHALHAACTLDRQTMQANEGCSLPPQCVPARSRP
ncbi:MAG: hypothetical protein KF729_33530 [Sandaracinaceae bacterium]|nr:hypothetical protein [Sandaracinaceae bacterium]